ncbi:hypothetical protein AHP1_211 [Aeromonas phage Ahp1_CNU-2021]|nr:hypothetical protein AHP1_211 [Aeromonas phage Ahp1_CNU-2021]
MSTAESIRSLNRYAIDHVSFLNSIEFMGSNEWRFEDAIVHASGRGTIRVNFKSHCRSEVVELKYNEFDSPDQIKLAFLHRKNIILGVD